jgi:hypothetical protein
MRWILIIVADGVVRKGFEGEGCGRFHLRDGHHRGRCRHGNVGESLERAAARRQRRRGGDGLQRRRGLVCDHGRVNGSVVSSLGERATPEARAQTDGPHAFGSIR